MGISKYLNKDLVVFLEEDQRDAAIQHLVTALGKKGYVENEKEFYLAILEREKIVSTGIGIGVAIPHAKMYSCENFFIAFGIQKTKGIDWNALDGSLVRLIFLVGGPDNKQTEYLRILSSLTQAIKDEGRRKKLLQAKTEEEVIELFAGC